MKYIIVCLFCFFVNGVSSQPVLGKHQEILLKKSVSCTGVKDQSMSSTCWSFASNSFIESELIKKGLGRFDLSEMFFARHAYINKINQHLATAGKSHFTPGGQFHDVIKVIREHGIVPEQAYPGKVMMNADHNHSELDTIIKYKMKDYLKTGKKQLSASDLKELNIILDTYLGKIPLTFTWKGKKYSPKTFASDVLKFKPDDYIEITSYTHHPFYSSFILEDKYNWSYDKYHNVPLTDFIAITDSALNNGYSICWDGDVSEQGFRYEQSTALLPSAVLNPVLERQSTYEDKTSGLDHMMHIVGMGKDKLNIKWYYIKNSWGNSNATAGYLWMQDDYFQIKTMAIIVNKNAIPSGIRKRMGI